MILNKQIVNTIVIFCLLLFSSSLLNAQTKAKDSLLFQIKNLRDQGGQSIQSEAYVDLLNALAHKYRYRHADSIKLFSDEAFLISSKINYPKGQAFALLRRGDYYSDSGLEKKAFVAYKQSKNIAFLMNYPTLKVEVLKSIAFHEFVSQNLYNAVLTFYKAIDLASENKLYESEALLRHNLGYCYYSHKLFDEAQIEYLVADSLWLQIDADHKQKAKTISNIALNAIDKGDLDLGYNYNERSIELLKDSEEPLWLSRAFRVKARFYSKKNEFKTAHKWIIKSDSSLNKINSIRDQMELDIIHSNILANLGDLDNAEKYSLKVLDNAIGVKDSFFLVQSYENLEKIEELLGRPDQAYTYYKEHRKIKLLLNENHKIQNVVLLRAKINFVKEKEALRLQNLKNNLTQQKYFQWITGALIASMFIALIMYKSSREEKRLNKKLEEKSNILVANEIDLKKTNTNQQILFSIVGHDLKGPILSLRELLKLMKNEKNQDVLLQTLLPKLNKYTDHVHFTLDNLLNWGKNQMKGQDITPSKLNLNSILSNLIYLSSETISKKKLKVELFIDKEVNAWADKEDINVVFRNLLSNAIKFTPSKGQISLSTKLEENTVVVAFTDNGIGMSTETQKLIFETNGHYSTFGTNNEKGTGLGLMLCKTLVSRNNGEISVISSENNGSTFSVFLPKK